MKSSQIYLKAFAAHVYLVTELFANLRRRPDFEETSQQCEQFTLEEILWGDINLPWAHFHASSLTTHIHDINVAHALILGRFRKSIFGDQFHSAVEQIQMDDPEFFHSRAEIDSLISDSNEIAHAFESKTDIKGFKTIRGVGRRLSITGVKPNWQIVGTRTQRDAELEEEVNRLRRTIDSLNMRTMKDA